MKRKVDPAQCRGISTPVRGTSMNRAPEVGKSLALARNRKGAQST